MSASCCDHHDDPQRGNVAFRLVLWIVLAINAIMFLVEVGAGIAAGSASLQADALDFLGDTANYAATGPWLRLPSNSADHPQAEHSHGHYAVPEEVVQAVERAGSSAKMHRDATPSARAA